MTLGATARDILLSFTQRGLVLTGIGVAIGLPLSAVSARLLPSALEIPARYSTSAAVVSLVLLIVVASASYVLALRASRMDPAVALRSESMVSGIRTQCHGSAGVDFL